MMVIGGIKSQKKLNYLRWVSLSTVFTLLLLIPFLYLYQTYVAANQYDNLLAYEKVIYRVAEFISSPFIKDPVNDLDGLKGTTWSGRLFGVALADPLAALSSFAATQKFYWPIWLMALLPLLLTLVAGRFFCGWICPATLIYELNDNLGVWLKKLGLPVSDRRLDRRIKYLLLSLGLVLSIVLGGAIFSAIYPPVILGRELHYAIAMSGFGVGIVFFLLTLIFDLLVARRGFCRYLCPGGALYALLGKFRLLRIQRNVVRCNDCAKCNAVCQFGLDPLRDGFGLDCNNCSACIQVCPTDALTFTFSYKDLLNQGPGHLGKDFIHKQKQEGRKVAE